MLAFKTEYDTLTTQGLPEKGTREWFLHKRARRLGRALGGGRIAKFREITKYKGITIDEVVRGDLSRVFVSEYYFYLWNVGVQLCTYCNAKLSRDTKTQDHVIPRCEGGAQLGRDNLVPCCRDCNGEKADKSLLAFLMDRARAWK